MHSRPERFEVIFRYPAVFSPLDMLRFATLAVFSLVVLGASYAVRVGETPVLPETPYDYEGTGLPAYLNVSNTGQFENTPADNPITNAGATLGRVLFYDVRLSKNGTISCASCHRQEHGFSDPEALSVGFEGERTPRNSMGLAFTRFGRNRTFFWDQRAPTLEHLSLEPIQDPVEMGMTLDEMTARLADTDFYPDLFADAFGTPEVTSDRVARALSQFVRSIVASNTRYDAALQAQGASLGRPTTGPTAGAGAGPLDGLTAQENRGLEIFFGSGACDQCHAGYLFAGRRTTSNGLDSTVTDEGAGRGRFAIVSLRNVGLTAPYMHDGRFATLEEAVDHYSTGVQAGRSLDVRLQRGLGRPLHLELSESDRDALVAFLHTLSDTTLATDPRWSNPFPTEAASEIASAAPRLDRVDAGAGSDAPTFRLGVEAPAHVRVEVRTALGDPVATLADERVEGETTVSWDTSDTAPGTYVVRAEAEDGGVATRVVLVAR